jgi:hypothetical protein
LTWQDSLSHQIQTSSGVHKKTYPIENSIFFTGG